MSAEPTPPPGVTLNVTIETLPDYDGHWRGLAFRTWHTYGCQVHRSRRDAERWNSAQAIVRPA